MEAVEGWGLGRGEGRVGGWEQWGFGVGGWGVEAENLGICLPYLLVNTYGLNFIKIRGIQLIHVTCDAHFRTYTRDDVCEHVCEVL